jgi:phosphoadenosine phosphosulfate reductase
MEGPSQSQPPDASPTWSPARLERIAGELETRPLDDVLRWGLETFGPGICLATSFGPQSIVLMHAIARLRPTTTVFYLDTELLFPETYALRDELGRRLGLRFTRVRPALTVEAQAAAHGPRLWSHQPDRCCELRKVAPLRRFLADKQAWITGIRNGHSQTRARTPLVEWDAGNGVVKLNPLVRWSSDRVWRYIRDHDLPFNPLHERGFPSIGCQPCTRAVRPGEDPRAGRWPGFDKTECGIHDSASGVLRLGPSAEETAT